MKLIFILLSLISICAFSKKGGAGVSGGGVGILDIDGTVRLYDLYENLSVVFFDRNRVLDNYYNRDNRYVKKLFTPADSFFSCAFEKFKTSKYRVLQDLVLKLEHVKPYLTEFRFDLIQDSKEYHLKQVSFPFVSKLIEDIPSKAQVSLAYYNEGTLLVQKRYYEALSREDKCALSVHEALRALSNSWVSLSDNDVVLLTRYLMNKRLSENEKLILNFVKKNILSNKIANKMVKFRKIRLSRIRMINYVSNGGVPTNLDMDNEIFYSSTKTSLPFAPSYDEVFNIINKYNKKIEQGYLFDVKEQTFVKGNVDE